MKGSVLDFNEIDGTGVISGDDGNRYSFSIENVKGDAKISRASKVDFSIDGDSAKDIYRAVGAMDSLGAEKNKFIAGLLAIFLGALGIHKFYLGRKTQGFIMLGLWLVGWIMVMTMVGVIIGAPILWLLYIVALIEGIMLLLKSQDEFQRIYVEGKKAWF